MQHQNSSNNNFRNGLPVSAPGHATQGQEGGMSGDAMGTNGDQYFSATFNAMGIQDFPPFTGAANRSTLTGPIGGTEHMRDDFAALNLAVGPPNNKSPGSMGDFEPKSPSLPHSSSTSSFASYASMFGQNPTSGGATTLSPTSGFSSSPAPQPVTASNTVAPMFGPPPSTPQNGLNASTANTVAIFSPQKTSSLSSPSAGSLAGHLFNPANQQLAPVSTQIPAASTNGLVFTSSVSPIHSPRISPSNSPLAQRRMQSPIAQRQTTIPHKSASSTLVQESVGGTTYFYNPEEFKPQNEGPQLVMPTYSAYPGMPPHMVHLRMKTSFPQYFAPDELKMDILNRHVLTMMQLDPASPNAAELPSEVDNYHNLCPMERSSPPRPSIGNMPSTTYKAVSTKDGMYYCLRRIHGFRLASTKVNTILESWKKLYHPNVVMLKEVFTTKAFNDNSIVFVYDYHAGAETLMSHHFSSQSHLNGYNHHHHHHSHHHHHYSRDHGKNSNSPRNLNNNLLAEGLIWTYIVQLSSALRAIHAAGLAARSLEPSRIIITGKARIRINCCGILDIITPESSGPQNVAAFKQDDLTAMGKIILALACNNLMCVQRDNLQSAIDVVQRNYSPDLKNLICYLLQNPNRIRSINDVMPMIGARFFTQLDTAQLRTDIVEHELAKEIENGRLFRIMIKLGSINERPEYNSEPSWAETGDRFMLKLFRDYLFHQVDNAGVPWIDMAHIIQCLNKFDAGVMEKVCLLSRDESSMLVVSYAELKRCFQSCFQELVAQQNQSTSSFS